MNSSLYGKTIQIPDKMLEYLETCFEHIPNSDASIEGHKRNEELRNSGYVTYQQLGRIKNWFDNYKGDGKDAPYILNGADYMKSWTDRTLESMRNGDSFTKRIETEHMPEPIDGKVYDDMGWLADMNRPSKDHSSFVQDIKKTSEIRRQTSGIRRQNTDDRNQIKIYLKYTPPGQAGWHRGGAQSDPTSVPGRWNQKSTTLIIFLLCNTSFLQLR